MSEMLSYLNPVKWFDTQATALNQLTDEAKAKVKAWVAAVDSVRNTSIPNDPDLAIWRDEILSGADRIKRMILALLSDNEAKSVGLGLGPLVIVGGVAIAGILAYIASQMVDISKYFARLNYIKTTAAQLKAGGASDQVALTQAVNAADNAGQTKALTIFGISATKIAIGVGCIAVVILVSRRKK